MNKKKLLVILLFLLSIFDNFTSQTFAYEFLDVGENIHINYVDKGEGQAIVFLPGWTFSTEVFNKQINEFKGSYRVISFDPRSHGRSTKVTSNNNYLTAGKDLAQLLKHLKIEKPILVGWSFGCLTAWQYVRDNDVTSVKANICIDLSPTPLTVNKQDWTEGSLSEVAGLYSSITSPKSQADLITWYADNVMIEKDLTPEFTDWIVKQSLQTPYSNALSYLASGMFSNYMKEAKALEENVPTLFFVANHWKIKAEKYLRRNTPNSKVVSFGGHMMFFEYPEKFNMELKNFLDALNH